MKSTLRMQILVAITVLISSYSFAQTSTLGGVLTNPTIFQKIKVTQEALFQGRVTFDNGLTLNGDAKFLNEIVGEKSLTIARDVRFNGLPIGSTSDYIITGNVTGDLSRISLHALAQQLQSQLNTLDALTVNNLTNLRGQVVMNQGMEVSGVANFANDMVIQGNLSVAGAFKLNLPSAVQEVLPGGAVLTFDPSNNSIVPVSGTVIGIPLDPELACPETPAPAFWERSANSLVTDRCSKNIKVGIGTQSPSQALDVVGNAKISNGVFASQLMAQNNGSQDPLVIKINGVNKFKVASNGKTYATEVNVVLANAFPDYVFHKDYKLMSITELDQYIQKNNHLPGMPTAEEVAKNGADLGELVRILVEKNEQMSLYIIQLENKTKEMDEKINKLEEQRK